MQVTLYSTLGCHLCEKAKQLLWPSLTKFQYRLVEVDISESDELIEKYGIRIPVLALTNNSAELSWPFTATEVDDFLSASLEI